MANCREFNFIAKENSQSVEQEYGGKVGNSYQGYTNKIFILDNSNNNTNGGITFINGMDHQARSVSTANNVNNI